MSSGCCVYLISFCGGAFCSFIKRMIFATSICHVNNGHISYVQNGWFLSCGSQHSNVYTPIWTYTYLRDLSWKNVLINLIEPRPTVQSQLLKFTGTCLCYIDSISGGSWIESFQLFLAIAHLTYQHKRYNLLTHFMIMYLLLFISTNWQNLIPQGVFQNGHSNNFRIANAFAFNQMQPILNSTTTILLLFWGTYSCIYSEKRHCCKSTDSVRIRPACVSCHDSRSTIAHNRPIQNVNFIQASNDSVGSPPSFQGVIHTHLICMSICTWLSIARIKNVLNHDNLKLQCTPKIKLMCILVFPYDVKWSWAWKHTESEVSKENRFCWPKRMCN